MTAKNFSPGDVVVCVENEGVPELVVRGIYTVVDAYDDNEGRPGVELAEVKPVGCDEGGEPYVGYGSESFRLAYTPDPEVEREADRIDCDKVRALIESGRRELKRVHGQ